MLQAGRPAVSCARLELTTFPAASIQLPVRGVAAEAFTVLALLLWVSTGALADCIGNCDAKLAQASARCPLNCNNPNFLTDCRQNVRDGYQGCTDPECINIAGQFPGRCTLAHECFQNCRLIRNRSFGNCNRLFRRVCPSLSCIGKAQQKHSKCVKKCNQKAAAQMSPAGLSEAEPGDLSDAEPQSGGCPCELDCVVPIVRNCYNSCSSRCEGDSQALEACRLACRNAQCNKLKQQCSDKRNDAGNPTNGYTRCCTRKCDGECIDEDQVNCTPTTTSSTSSTTVRTTSTTVTTVTSTTSTTLFIGM